MWPTCHLHDIIESPLIADQFPDHCADQFSAVLVDCDAIPDLSEPPPPAPRVGLRLEMTRQWIELQLVLLIFGWLPNLRYLEIPFPFFASSHTRTCGADLKTKGEVTQNHKKKKAAESFQKSVKHSDFESSTDLWGYPTIFYGRTKNNEETTTNPYESIQWRELLSPNLYHPKTDRSPWKMMVGRPSSLFEMVPWFRGHGNFRRGGHININSSGHTAFFVGAQLLEQEFAEAQRLKRKLHLWEGIGLPVPVHKFRWLKNILTFRHFLL